MPPVSRKQAAFFGSIVGGAIKKKGLSKNKAKEFLRGVKVSSLPAKAGGMKKSSPKASKGSTSSDMPMKAKDMMMKGKEMMMKGKAMMEKARMMMGK